MAKTNYHIFVENGKVGLKDAAGRVVQFAVYDSINFTDANTPICVCRDGKWGLADVNGWTIVDRIKQQRNKFPKRKLSKFSRKAVIQLF